MDKSNVYDKHWSHSFQLSNYMVVSLILLCPKIFENYFLKIKTYEIRNYQNVLFVQESVSLRFKVQGVKGRKGLERIQTPLCYGFFSKGKSFLFQRHWSIKCLSFIMYIKSTIHVQDQMSCLRESVSNEQRDVLLLFFIPTLKVSPWFSWFVV